MIRQERKRHGSADGSVRRFRVFLFHRKLRPMKQKRSAVDRTAADWKMSLTRPATGGESCEQDSFSCLLGDIIDE